MYIDAVNDTRKINFSALNPVFEGENNASMQYYDDDDDNDAQHLNAQRANPSSYISIPLPHSFTPFLSWSEDTKDWVALLFFLFETH